MRIKSAKEHEKSQALLKILDSHDLSSTEPDKRATAELAALSLIQSGAALDLQSQHGWPALSTATAQNNLPVVTALIDAGAPLDAIQAGGYTPLMWAVRFKYHDIADALLTAGANKDLCGTDGLNVLMYAGLAKDDVMMEKLILAGADLSLKLDVTALQMNLTALNYAIHGGCSRAALMLLDRGLDMYSVGIFDEPLLHTAAGNGMTAVVKRMIDLGYPIDKQDRNYITAAMRAAQQPDTLRVLLEAGADVTLRGGNNAGVLRDHVKDPALLKMIDGCRVRSPLEKAQMKQGVMTKGKVQLVPKIVLKKPAP